MTSAMTKIGRTLLAALLAAFVCVTPALAAAPAYADEQAEAQDEYAGLTEEQIQELLRKKLVEEQAAQKSESEASTEAEAVGETEQPAATETAEAGKEATEEPAAMNEASKEAEESEVVAAPETAQVSAATPEAAVAATLATVSDDPTNPTPAERDGNTFKVSTYMQLRDVLKYDINTQSGQSFVISLTGDIVIKSPESKVRDEATHTYVYTYDTHGKKYLQGTDNLKVKNGNTVTILGNGHTISYSEGNGNNFILGTISGNLILGAADGSDSLTITFGGSSHQLGSLVDITGGTLAIHSGVTLSNNVNGTGYTGGAVSVTNGGVVTMDGGLIENSSNDYITWGGGVSVDGGTFNMTGGTIRGNSEVAYGDYPGYGGGVALGAHGDASTFNMSGDAVIEGNSAPNGGGVYVGKNSTFTMDGNASICNNTASSNGGGVYVAEGGTFTMGENATITGNSAPYGGGLINFGTATVSNVYDNDAATAGADIYNKGTLTMEPVKAEWSLSREQATSDPNGVNGSGASTPTDVQPDLKPITFASFAAVPSAATLSADDADDSATATTAAATATNPSNTTIDDWYYDGHRETGDAVETNRWNANADTADTPQYLVHYAATGTPTTETMGLKAAHEASNSETPDTPETPETPETVNVFWENYDGTVLFELDKVEVGHVPAADEYVALSGHENPTEPADGTTEYEFEGWERSVEPNGDVIYTAQYEPENPSGPNDPTNPVDPKTPDDPHTPDPVTTPVTTQPTESTDPTPAAYTPNSATTTATGASLQQTGDQMDVISFGAAALALIAFAGIELARRKDSKN